MKKIFFATTLCMFVSLTPSFAQDVPASPLEKEGYRLVFHDEFDGTELDRTKWVPEYLPSWIEDREISSPVYDMKDGILTLRVDKESTKLFRPSYICGFMSASRTGLHHNDPKRKVMQHIKTEAPHMNQYGYYEMRAKVQRGGGVHTAWWLVGFQDDPKQTGEVDIFEILGPDVNRVWATIHPWKDSIITYHYENPWFANKKLDKEYHIYGFDWTPEGIAVYVDGIRIMSHKVDISYPLIQIISMYDNRTGKKGWNGVYDPKIPYPKTFCIDYVRVYKKIPEGFKAVKPEDLRITHIDSATLNITPEGAVLRNIGGHITPEILNTPTYVNVHYNDGTVTQQFVEWEPVNDEILARIKEPGTVIIDGKITGLPEELLQGSKASLIINTIKTEKDK